MKRRVTTAVLLIVAACGCLARPNPAAAAPAKKTSPVLTTSLCFQLTEFSPADAVVMAGWLDEVLARFRATSGLDPGCGNGEAIEVRALRSEATAAGQAVESQALIGGKLMQRIVLVNPAAVDQEDLLESVTMLLLSRALSQSAGTSLNRLPVAPAWVSVGLAQNLYPDLQQRNRESVRGLAEPLPLQQVVTYQKLPPGRWPEKYWSGLALQWITDSQSVENPLPALWRLLGAGGKPDMKWVSEDWLHYKSVADAEAAWSDWLAGRSAGQTFKIMSREDAWAELDRCLVVEPGRAGIRVDGLPEVSCSWKDLIAYSGEDWMTRLVQPLAVRLEMLGLGQDEEFRAMLRLHTDFLHGLATRKRGAAGVTEKSLNKMLAAAGTARERVRKLQAAQRNYLNLVEYQYSGKHGTGEGPAPDFRAIQRYLDGIEAAGGSPEKSGEK